MTIFYSIYQSMTNLHFSIMPTERGRSEKTLVGLREDPKTSIGPV
ncbi:hypothetical protein [Algivirga pacifica]